MMDDRRVIAAAQELLRQLQEPDRLQNIARALGQVADLLNRRVELTDGLVRLEDETRRAKAESTSRVQECQQQEDAAQRRKTDAEMVGQRELATLGQTRTQLKEEITALYDERRSVSAAIQQARDEQAAVLADIARERTIATAALEAVRASLAKLREAIPA